MSAPVEVEGHSLAVSASVGVAVLPPGETVAVDEGLRRADVAMYRAKARGKHQYATWTPELDADTGGQPPAAPQPARHARYSRPAAAT